MAEGNPEEQRKTFIANLKSCAEFLSEKRLIGLIEPINGYSKPGYFLNDFDTALTIVKSVDSPHIRLQLDLFHLQLISGDITHTIKKVLPYVGKF